MSIHEPVSQEDLRIPRQVQKIRNSWGAESPHHLDVAILLSTTPGRHRQAKVLDSGAWRVEGYKDCA